ncbi:hypothetical protein D3261_07095 [Halococcus sp. IIIV-5B]|nr:hypothetical protein D3261_07095 [Halococcus sp. IIIV-5B]
MNLGVSSEHVLSGMERLAALCIALGLILGLMRRLVFQLPSRLGVWMMFFGLFLLILTVALDRTL